MKSNFAISLSLLLLFCFFGPSANAGPLENSARFWISEYGAISRDKNQRVSGAYEIFDRIGSVAGKRMGGDPNLIVLSSLGKSCAFCIQDGTVLLSIEGLNLCYRGVDKATGDARLAFLLGHEISHLKHNDLWHIRAFQNFQEYSVKTSYDEAMNLLNRSNTDPQELKADTYGLLYASMAGFDPKVVVNDNGMNFFQEWTDISNDSAPKTPYGKQSLTEMDSHPDPETRADNLLTFMKSVVSDIELFDIGKRLIQIARYRDAMSILEAFSKTYPCREVFNNMGVTCFQMAIAELADCDPAVAYQFNLASVIDTETRSSGFLPSAERGRKCLDETLFRKHIQKAVQYFKKAIDQDPYYIPARINLSSAMILKGEYHNALGILNDVLEKDAKNPGALNNKGVALYLLGPELKVDMFAQSIDILRGIRLSKPKFLPALYNLGRIRWFRNRDAGAKESWMQYLKEKPRGEYSDLIRSELGIEHEKPMNDHLSPVGLLDNERVPTLRLGMMDPSVKLSLSRSDIVKESYNLEDIFVELYSKGFLKILVVEDVIELIEDEPKRSCSLFDIRKKYGYEKRRFDELSGVCTYVYDRFMVDVKDGFVKKVIIFDNV